MSHHPLRHLPGIVPFAHRLLRQALQPGDVALDATAGKGKDTVVLAQCVGSSGRVIAFDIQPSAIALTRQRLQALDLLERVTLVESSHVHVPQYVQAGLAAAIFNLGYLPGSDKALCTQAESTVLALNHTLELLRPGGLLAVVLYPAHAADKKECAAVEGWMAALDAKQSLGVRYQLVNKTGTPPYVLAVEKR